MCIVKVVILSTIVAIDIKEFFIIKAMCIQNMQSASAYIFGYLSWYLLCTYSLYLYIRVIH